MIDYRRLAIALAACMFVALVITGRRCHGPHVLPAVRAWCGHQNNWASISAQWLALPLAAGYVARD
jgi:hypothetical protein